MKLSQKLVEEAIIEIAGREGVMVYKVLKDKENVNEFLIAEKLKLTINQIRNIIYKFEQYNLITSTRKKDRKKGWYIYFFTLNKKQIEDLVLQLKKKKINILKKQLEREGAHDFYSCPNKCMRLTIENAMEHQFMCAECGSLLEPEDKEKNITKIKKGIKELEEEFTKITA
ncbi:hypothetical protein J4230_05140 [Candidatus Woesearchaeota archaeon]|nr:hypothetical protein [Candidatus Woesearchaeota archaeon]